MGFCGEYVNTMYHDVHKTGFRFRNHVGTYLFLKLKYVSRHNTINVGWTFTKSEEKKEKQEKKKKRRRVEVEETGVVGGGGR